MAIVPTPSRHLAALVTPQFKHLGGIGESILSKRPNWRLRKMVYGGQAGSLGQIADYGSDTDLWGPGGADYNAGTTYTPSTGASQNLTLNDIEGGGCIAGSTMVNGTCFNPTSPTNSLVLSNGQTIAGGSAAATGSTAASLIASAIAAGARVATVAELPSGTSLLANGAVVSSAASISSMLPILLIGGLVLVLAMGGRQ